MKTAGLIVGVELIGSGVLLTVWLYVRLVRIERELRRLANFTSHSQASPE